MRLAIRLQRGGNSFVVDTGYATTSVTALVAPLDVGRLLGHLFT